MHACPREYNSIDAAAASKRIAELRREIERHDRLYYVEAAPVVSDREYDGLFDELRALESAHPELASPDSPTGRVGGEPLKTFAHVAHAPPMLSLDKADDAGGLQRFDARIRKVLGDDGVAYAVEPKIDGVSVALRYEDGRLTLAATRGNGTTGDDITANVRTIRGVPLRLPADGGLPARLEARGEAYLDRAAFADLNRQLADAGEKTFPSARNAAAGSLKLLDPRLVARRPLRVVVYAVAAPEDWPAESHYESLCFLRSLGLPVPQRFWRCATIDAALARAEECKRIAETLPYDIDGAVIKLDRRTDWRRLGATSHHPQYAVAYKPRHWLRQARTRLLGITVQVGRTGVLTPVAELEPVFLDGSTIARATLHNAEDIERKDIRVGDTVVIERAGMVIPAVVHPLKERRSGKERPFAMPSACPACGSSVTRRRTAGAGGGAEVAWRCENLQCPAQKTRRLQHFASRAALDIEGLGEALADALVRDGLVSDPLDLFDLDPDALRNLSMGGDSSAVAAAGSGATAVRRDSGKRTLGEKNAAKMLAARDRARSLPLERWLYALAIPNVGTATARRLARLHTDLESVAGSAILKDIVDRQAVIEALKDARSRRRRAAAGDPDAAGTPADGEVGRLETRLRELEKRTARLDLTDLGPVAARAVIDFFAAPAGRRILENCRRLGIAPRSAPEMTPATRNTELSGKTIVVTGALAGMSRMEVENRIRAAGGTVAAAVSGRTDFLVTGAEPGASKLRQAERHGVRRISATEFMTMLA